MKENFTKFRTLKKRFFFLSFSSKCFYITIVGEWIVLGVKSCIKIYIAKQSFPCRKIARTILRIMTSCIGYISIVFILLCIPKRICKSSLNISNRICTRSFRHTTSIHISVIIQRSMISWTKAPIIIVKKFSIFSFKKSF